MFYKCKYVFSLFKWKAILSKIKKKEYNLLRNYIAYII